MGVIEKLKTIISELTIKPEVPKDRVKRLTEEDKKTLSDCINNLIYNEMTNSSTIVAVYVNAYKTTEGVQIYVNFADSTCSKDDCRAVQCKVKGIKIDKVKKSSWGFSSFIEVKDGKKVIINEKALINAKELLSCFFIMTRYGWYENYIENAKKFGLTKYDNAIVEPLLDMSETKKLTFYDWYAINLSSPKEASLTKYNKTIPLNVPLDMRKVHKLSSANQCEWYMQCGQAYTDTSETSVGQQKTIGSR